jgi:hypothetical protein
MGKSKPHPSISQDSSHIQRQLEELAQHVDDRKKFLMLAKSAWNEKHYMNMPRRGKRSVEDLCLRAIIDELDELKLAYFPYSGYEIIDNYHNEISEWQGPPYQRFTLGRLAQIIRRRVPGIKPSTARKYARIWERDSGFPRETESERRVRGMALYKETKKKLPRLYQNSKPTGRS